MKIAIGTFVLLGILLLVWARHVDSRATNTDDWDVAFAEIAGFISLAAAAVLTMGLGLWRLFTS